MKALFRRLSFGLWYLIDPPWDSGISPPELLDFIEKHTPGRAIDLGCGTGTNLITLAQAGWQVTGVDFVPRAIRKARRKLKRFGVQAELHTGDVTDLEGIEGPFDLALDIGCFHGIGERKEDYLAELDRILATGGYWLMYAIFKDEALASRPGLVEADLELIPNSMTLLDRQDGTDRRERPSTWFLFQKSGNNP